jgi:REP-associated tyrosine transposase
MPSTFTNLNYHLIFGTRYRRPLITEQWESDLYNYIAGIINNHDGVALEINGMPDHIHILCGLKPTMCVADTIRLVKSNSSKWVNERDTGKRRFEWQVGYAAFSVSYSNRSAVRQYIRDQKEHHAKRSFGDEYIEFLKRHGISFEPKYLFEEEHVG